MSKNPSKENDIPTSSHIGFPLEHESSVKDSTWDTRQNSPI